ncbi:MAG: hypothetical protein VB144_02035 [Clostridia bacterium]|nr:hypothetical protein [Clostridia bacterium]
MSSDNWDDIKTRFVRDRLAETAWEDRMYIGKLMVIESFVERGGPHAWAEAMVHHSLKEQFPLEIECISKEIREGIMTTAEQFNEMKLKAAERSEQWLRERRLRAQQQQDEEKRRLEESHKQWRDKGGK